MTLSREVTLALLIILIAAFGLLSWLVMGIDEAIFELPLTRRVQSALVPWLRPLLRAINFPGYPPQVYILTLLLVLIPFLLGWKWVAATQAFVPLGVGLTATIVKHIVHRPRPTADAVLVQRVLDQGGLSYPAGHCADYTARFGFIIYLLLLWVTPSGWMWLVIGILFLFIALVGLARLYSGEHWLTDVLGGYLLGGIWLILTIILYNLNPAL